MHEHKQVSPGQTKARGCPARQQPEEGAQVGPRDTDGGWDTVEPPSSRRRLSGLRKLDKKMRKTSVRIGSAMQKFILTVPKAAPFVLTPL